MSKEMLRHKRRMPPNKSLHLTPNRGFLTTSVGQRRCLWLGHPGHTGASELNRWAACQASTRRGQVRWLCW